jgi:uncharacterized protein (DUF736 family)
MADRNVRDPLELGALWERTSQSGKTYLTGTVSGEAVVCFEIKGRSDKQPKYRVLKSQPRDGRPAASDRLDTREPAQRRPSRVDDIDADIPY